MDDKIRATQILEAANEKELLTEAEYKEAETLISDIGLVATPDPLVEFQKIIKKAIQREEA